jgi:hypothetical protein
MVGGVIFTLVAVVALVAVGALYGFRGYEGLACRALKQRYEDLEIHDSPQIGDVALVYHTYHGVLAWFTQTEHRVYLPPEQARALLGRLFRFNLVWGLTARGGLLVPPLSLMNYVAQRRSISAQEWDSLR